MINDRGINALILSGLVLGVAACSGDAGDTTQSGATGAGASASPSAAGASGGTMAMQPGAMTGGAGGMTQTPSMMNPMAGAGTGGAMPAMPMGGSMMPAGGMAGAMADAGAGGMMGGGILPAVDSTEEDGPFEATAEAAGEFYVYRPVELGKDGVKHPVFIWGTGAGATPDRYGEYFPQFATHGFIVVSPNKAQKAASDLKAALDWIIAQSEDSSSPYFEKVDTTRVGMGGHSQGSVATFDQEGMEDRLKTTIHIAGGSFDMRGSSKVKTPTAYICGETDFALPNCEADFETVEDKPTFFSVLMGVDHVACARNAMPGMIAWLRWHLADESERAAEFTGPDGKFHMGIWSSQTKNWNF